MLRLDPHLLRKVPAGQPIDRRRQLLNTQFLLEKCLLVLRWIRQQQHLQAPPLEIGSRQRIDDVVAQLDHPLASIKTFTEYLGTKFDDPDFRAKFRRIVGGEVERINLIVQQLLDFSRPAPPRLEPVAVEQLLEETLQLLESEFVQRQVELTRRYEGRRTVLGDSQQLKQVFINLLLNSLQALQDGTRRIELQTTVEGSEVCITIRDTGTGIPSELLPRLFEPFHTTKPHGTGLGLAVVQGIIQEHQGRIDLASTPGTGTTVTIRLPLAAV